jgi:hypothetical protein
MSTVSVIIPAYNHGHLVEEAIASVLSQAWSSVEIIVVDDGSTDGTEAILEPHRSSGVIRFVHQPNRGLGAARNRGLDLATGDYVQFLDADDLLLSGKFAAQVAALERDRTLGATHCDFRCTDGVTGDRRAKYASPRVESSCILDDLILRWELDFSIPCHCFLFARTALQGLRFATDLPNHEDWDFYVRWALAGNRSGYVDEELCVYRMFSGSMAKDQTLMAKGREMVLQRIASYSAHCEKLARYRRRAERHRATRAWVANLGGRVKSLIKRLRSSER